MASNEATTTSAPVVSPEQKVDIKLYWLEKSRSQRILWLLEELKLPYSIETFKRNPKTMLAPPELKKIHPLGKSPVISLKTDGMKEPITIAESGLIVEYLCDHYGQSLIPQKWQPGKENQVGGETEEWFRYKYYLHYAEGSLMGLMVVALVVQSKFSIFFSSQLKLLRSLQKRSASFNITEY
jgi:glutathione S-transferase